jgi:eukaryotic-like serine/threonine-protein kinase
VRRARSKLVLAVVVAIAALTVILASHQKPLASALFLNTAIHSMECPDGIVIQQNGASGSITLEGQAGLFAKAVEVAVVPRSADCLRPESWHLLSDKLHHGHFEGTTRLQGGWNVVYLRTVGQGKRLANPIEIGVGEVFVVAGQSNAEGGSETLFLSRSALVRCGQPKSGGEILWRSGDDPQVAGGGGSVWPLVGENLSARLGLPVAFINVAVGGSSISEWQPGTVNFKRLVQVLRAQPCSVRAVLWQQGESDFDRSGAEYEAMLRRLIEACREALPSSHSVPWMVATTSYANGKTSESVRAAQHRVCESGLANQGPDTDGLGTPFRDNLNIHFNEKGTRKAAELWVEAITQRFFPGF